MRLSGAPNWKDGGGRLGGGKVERTDVRRSLLRAGVVLGPAGRGSPWGGALASGRRDAGGFVYVDAGGFVYVDGTRKAAVHPPRDVAEHLRMDKTREFEPHKKNEWSGISKQLHKRLFLKNFFLP